MKILRIALVIFSFTTLSFLQLHAVTVHDEINNHKKALASAKGRQKIHILIRLSELKEADSLNDAYIYARQALQFANKESDRQSIALSSVQLASIMLRDSKKIDSAYIMLQLAYENFRQSNTSNSARYYYQTARYNYHKNNLAEVIENAHKAEALSVKEQDMYVCGLSRVLLAKAFRKQSNQKLFVQYLNLASQSFAESNDSIKSGPALISVGIMLNDAGLPELADKVLLKAAQICESTADSIFMAYQYANISGIFATENYNDKTYEYLQKSLKIFRKKGNKQGMAYSLNILGGFYSGNKEYAKSIDSYNESAQLAVQCGNWQGACFAAANTVESLIYLEKFKEAEVSLQKTAEYATKSNDNLAKTVYHFTAGYYYAAIRNYSKSIEEYKLSLNLAYAIKNANFMMNSLKAIADNYQASGDEKQASNSYRRYIEVRDSINSIAQKNRRQELLDNFDVDNSRKSTDNLLGTSYIKWGVVSAAAISLLLVIAVVVRHRKKLYKATESVNSKNELQNSDFKNQEIKMPKLHLNENLRKDIWEKLENLMTDEHLYRQPDLSLAEISEKLLSNTTYVSKIINDQTDSNFTTFVNRYRIEEACKLLTDPHSAHLSIEGIAYTVGFNSKSAFNTAFKKYTGKTPSEYASDMNSKKAVPSQTE